MSTLCNVTTNGGGGGGAEGGGDCDDNNFPPRFVSEAAKSTFKYLKKVQLDHDEVGDEYRWAPFAFQLIPPEDNHRNVEKSELFKKIRLAGGTIHPGADVEAYVPGVIRILNEDYYIQHEDEDIRVPLDTYSSAFIYRCILNKNRGLPLPHPWKYLIPSETSNFGFYDARRILREEIEWEDVGKLVFPPDQKRITAQQWLDELRRQQAKLLGPPDPVDDNPPSQTNGTSTPTTSASIEAPANNLPSTSASCRMVHDSSPNHRTNTQRKRSHEPDKDDTTDKPSSSQTTPQKKKDTPQPNSSPASAPVASASSSGGQAPLAATPCSSKALSASQVKILVKAVKLPGSSPTTNSSASSPSSPPPPRRIEFERAVPPKPAQSSSTSSPTPSTSKTEPPSPKKMKTDSKSNSSSNATAARSGLEGKNLGSKEQSSETTSRPSSPKSHSSAKGNGSVRNPTSSSASSSSSTSSVSGKESSLPSKTRLGKIVAVAGPPKTRRYGPKPNPPPARDDGWVNCDDKNERSSDESVHFSDNDNGNGSDDSEVDVKPKLKPFWARLYSVEEGQRLLDLVCHHNAYRYVHGLKFWKLVEDSKKFKDRTYQSLRGHFHKIVVQKLTSTSKRDQSIYKIEPENLKKLKRGLENKSKKHHNLCPHFEI